MPRRLPRIELAGEVDLAALTRWLFIAVWAVSAAYALHYLDRGWFPHDLGALAEPASRVLRGEWPHRDFQDVYTGGLALLDALAFAVLGPSAMSLRWALFAFYLAWVPAVWYVARRVAGPVLAALATLLAAAWTLPIYAEGMPSWYNLFLATFGTVALFRWLDVGRRRWLFLAGVAGGLSIVVKIVGLYYVAGALVFLAWMGTSERARTDGRGASSTTEGTPDRPPAAPVTTGAYRWVVLAGALALSTLVAALVVRAMGLEGLLRFGIPALAPPLSLAAMTVRGWTGRADGWRRALAPAAFFLAGVAVPVVLFTIPYALSGSVGSLLRGVFVLPRRRFASASWSGLQGHGLGAALALVVVIWVAWAPRLRRAAGLVAALAAGLLLAGTLVTSGRVGVYRALWETLWWLPPWIALAAALFLLTGGRAGDAPRTFALFAIYGLSSLVEVPFAAPVYFFYAAPLMVLLALALVAGRAGSRPEASVAPSRGRTGRLVGMLAYLLAFTAIRLAPGFIRNLGFTPAHDAQRAELALPRSGGLHIDAAGKEEYETVVHLIEAHARGPYIYATPDCPEIYFLSAHRNPTGILYEFLDPDRIRPSRVLGLLDRDDVRVVVINRRPLFSAPVDSTLVAGLQTRYPFAQEVGRFLVVWKGGGP